MNRKHSEISTADPTRYEVAVIRDGKVLETLGFTARKSKQGILALLTRDITEYFSETEQEGNIYYTSKLGFVLEAASAIKESGEQLTAATQAEIIVQSQRLNLAFTNCEKFEIVGKTNELL